jgi:RNase P protein component
MFRVATPLDLKKLESLFRHKVFRMLLNRGKITEEMIRMISAWKHSGFHVFCGNRISPNDATAMKNLARHIIRASFSQERMQYLDQEAKVVYASKACSGPRSGDGKSTKVFDALEWLAAMCSHVQDRGEQMVRSYGHYSNVSRGKRQESAEDDDIPCIIESEEDAKAHRRKWSRLLQKIYEVDPLICPKCQGTMRIISSIEDEEIIKAILKHFGLWLIKSRPVPKAHSPTVAACLMDDHSQIPINDDHHYRDSEYSWDTYIQA